MPSQSTYSGISVLGDIKWGTHFSTFYNTEEDLLEIMVSYFSAGLRNNEFCFWIYAQPLSAKAAFEAFNNRIPHAGMYLDKGQLVMARYDEFYLDGGVFNPTAVLEKWRLLYEIAMDSGYTGVRVSGIESWVGDEIWKTFMEYEVGLDKFVTAQKIVVHCSFPLNRSDSTSLIDVAHIHEKVIARTAGEWLVLEQQQIHQSKAQLAATNEKLEELVRERTVNLEQIILQMETEAAARLIAEKKLIRTARDLEKRNADLQQFGYIVSHNLRGPITNILGIALLLDEMPEQRAMLQENMLQAIDQLEDIIRDLNQILKVKFELSEAREVVRFADILASVRSSIAQHIEKTGAVIETDFSNIDQITTARAYLYSIFLNLLDNSLKYRHPDRSPVIRISSQRIGNTVRLTFCDNGQGIDVEKHGMRVFGLYQRFSAAVPGRGMGLFMVKAQAESLGGTASVTSIVGEGSRFILDFPANNGVA